MHRIRSSWAFVALAVLSLTAPVAAQGDPESVTIESRAIAGSVFMLTGSGGNIGASIGADGVVLIDDQFAPLTDKIRAAVSKLSAARSSTDRIRFVINTHWHGDHTGGNENLAGQGALVVAHANVRGRMSVEQFMEFFDRTTPPSPAAALPVVTFTESVTFHVNDETIEVVHVPAAHTDGDAIVHFRSANVVHAGDIYFNGLYPFIDTSSGGSVDGVIAAVGRILERCDDATRVIPGHGPLSDRKELLAYRTMLSDVRDRVERRIRTGESLEQVTAARPTADYDEKWGGGFLPPDKFLAIVYASLAR